jgi:predicted naringenin-chalcone synthase
MDPGKDALWLAHFTSRRPEQESDQRWLLDWLAEAHADSGAATDGLDAAGRDALRDRLRRVIGRCACGPDRIARRAHAIGDAAFFDPRGQPHGPGAGRRTLRYGDVVRAYFASEYAGETEPPRDLVHVTCTGYISPSGAQELVAAKGWGARTRVTHAYHMGCYAALPAIRLAVGCQLAPDALAPSDAAPRVDLVHTELCTLHFDPGLHSLEQFVVQSLFAAVFIRYALVDERARPPGPALRLLALAEQIVPDSADAMRWMASDFGMEMTLARDVPQRIAAYLRGFVAELCARAGLDAARTVAGSAFAVHPGGPRVIDGVRDGLELREDQVRASREVLHAYGNMSSATLPHVWLRLLADDDVRPGTPIASLAFGPGLTIAGALLRKE